MLNSIIEVLKWIWFLITLPYFLIKGDHLGGAGGLESEFEDYQEENNTNIIKDNV